MKNYFLRTVISFWRNLKRQIGQIFHFDKFFNFVLTSVLFDRACQKEHMVASSLNNLINDNLINFFHNSIGFDSATIIF